MKFKVGDKVFDKGYSLDMNLPATIIDNSDFSDANYAIDTSSFGCFELNRYKLEYDDGVDNWVDEHRLELDVQYHRDKKLEYLLNEI